MLRCVAGVSSPFSMELVWSRALLAAGAITLAASSQARAAPRSSPLPGPMPSSVTLFVDGDDDDGDGVVDRDQGAAARTSAEVQWLETGAGDRQRLRSIRGKGVRVLSGGGTFAEGSPPRELDARFGLVGVSAGAARVRRRAGLRDPAARPGGRLGTGGAFTFVTRPSEGPAPSGALMGSELLLPG